jgi:hypothetical protein
MHSQTRAQNPFLSHAIHPHLRRSPESNASDVSFAASQGEGQEHRLYLSAANALGRELETGTPRLYFPALSFGPGLNVERLRHLRFLLIPLEDVNDQ